MACDPGQNESDCPLKQREQHSHIATCQLYILRTSVSPLAEPVELVIVDDGSLIHISAYWLFALKLPVPLCHDLRPEDGLVLDSLIEEITDIGDAVLDELVDDAIWCERASSYGARGFLRGQVEFGSADRALHDLVPCTTLV